MVSMGNFFTKMTQNGLKWILNTTLKIVTKGCILYVIIFMALI